MRKLQLIKGKKGQTRRGFWNFQRR